jgi:parallel beta-helix repeat protein
MDMMRFFLMLSLFSLSACAVPADRPVADLQTDATTYIQIGGILIGETVLDGRYLLTNDLLIPEGSRLIIKPGSTVLVRRAELTKIDPEFLSSMTEILIRGELQIEGTDVEPVHIVSEKDPNPSDPAWAGILLDNAATSSIQHALISGAEIGVLMIHAEIELLDSQLTNNRYGVIIQSGQPVLQRNQICLGESGVYLWNGATPVLIENVMKQNQEEGLYIDRTSRPILSGNLSVQNALGLVSVQLPDAQALQLTDNGEQWRKLSHSLSVQQ